MTSQLTINLLRVLFVVFCAAIGSIIAAGIHEVALPGLFLGLIFGLLLVLADRLLKGFSLRAFSSATLGLLLGLICANLLLASQILRYQSESTQWIARLMIYSAFGYLGTMLALRSNRDEFSLIIPYVRFARETTEREPLLVDTNVIIDGRIVDLCATGFLSRSLIVPRFVLGELHLLADARDISKRERGRRGLEVLHRLQNAPGIDLTIHESTEDPELPVDARLVRVAKMVQARLLTNDQPLCQVARLQQVPVLNLSDLTRALQPTVTPGDEVDLQLVKEGRESHQALGYLPDGTMIVVNHGRPHLGKTVAVVVASALQTLGGRMIFAELKESGKNRPTVLARAVGE